MGRLDRRVRFLGPIVVKSYAAFDGPESAAERLQHLDSAFAPSVVVRGTRLMLRGRPATLADLPAARDLLRERLWDRPAHAWNFGWKTELLAHLARVYPSARLLDRVAALPPVNRHVRVHGDATVANLVRYPVLGVRWIDPLWRSYIPGDPLVDVGKCLQSVYGYEDALTGKPLVYHSLIAGAILHGLTTEERWIARTWLMIHCARLLRYHTKDVADKFHELLEDEFECKLAA